MKSLNVYLSIDLDYWRHAHERWYVLDFFRKVQARVKTAKLPVTVAFYHHHLVDDINAWCQQLNRVINVDYHSDIVDEVRGADLRFNEGSWANFIHFRGDGTFEWRYPDSKCLSTGEGYCHEQKNPFLKPEVAGWKRTVKRRGLGNIPWDDIFAVGIVLSPDWIGNVDIIYPILEGLQLFEWLGRWHVWKDNCQYRAIRYDGMESGTGIWAPHLTSLDFVL
jgi:hypothetical protein